MKSGGHRESWGGVREGPPRSPPSPNDINSFRSLRLTFINEKYNNNIKNNNNNNNHINKSYLETCLILSNFDFLDEKSGWF